MTLLTEIQAEARVPKGPDCSVAKLLLSLPDDDADDLRTALADPSISSAAISRALRHRGVDRADTTLARHRRADCRCPR